MILEEALQLTVEQRLVSWRQWRGDCQHVGFQQPCPLQLDQCGCDCPPVSLSRVVRLGEYGIVRGERAKRAVSLDGA